MVNPFAGLTEGHHHGRPHLCVQTVVHGVVDHPDDLEPRIHRIRAGIANPPADDFGGSPVVTGERLVHHCHHRRLLLFVSFGEAVPRDEGHAHRIEIAGQRSDLQDDRVVFLGCNLRQAVLRFIEVARVTVERDDARRRNRSHSWNGFQPLDQCPIKGQLLGRLAVFRGRESQGPGKDVALAESRVHMQYFAE